MEIWKDIEGYEGLYQASNMGRVKSLPKKKGKGVGYVTSELILKPSYDLNGYLIVTLYRERQPKMHCVHRLVAKTFIDNPDNKPQVNHLNEKKDDNRVENLEWATAYENMNYGSRNDRSSERLGTPVVCVELNEKFQSMMEAERILGINHSCISLCVRGKQKTAGKYHWQYYEEAVCSASFLFKKG